MLKNILAIVVISTLWFCSCKNGESPDSKATGDEKMQIKITSPVFSNGSLIPSKYTCDGQNVSPPLQWQNVPAAAKSLAIICDDPDAPVGTWVHWVLYNLPPDTTQLAENIPADRILVSHANQGTNDFRKIGYGGPCPPSGTHRYFFKIYALDTTIDLQPGATKKQLLNAARGHIIGTGELIGKYSRQ